MDADCRVKKFLSDIVTEKDGETIDPVRLYGGVGFVIYNFLSISQLFLKPGEFSLVQYATGLSMILGAIAAGITFKYRNEKDC